MLPSRSQVAVQASQRDTLEQLDNAGQQRDRPLARRESGVLVYLQDDTAHLPASWKVPGLEYTIEEPSHRHMALLGSCFIATVEIPSGPRAFRLGSRAIALTVYAGDTK
ncbi:hypothetical protein EVAR_33706_1 [Eumeta japonica]|uniref:Uncharacterized protein n=1 Tax=Eumeta variegata TaxID=151549 RepID=A0A4C1VV66_EUMVA|nr:hypothetical protein EVAR_33706_1 [Eumeta japonica]